MRELGVGGVALPLVPEEAAEDRVRVRCERLVRAAHGAAVQVARLAGVGRAVRGGLGGVGVLDPAGEGGAAKGAGNQADLAVHVLLVEQLVGEGPGQPRADRAL